MMLIYILSGAAVSLFFAWFGVSSLGERKPRAAIISFGLAVVNAAVWAAYGVTTGDSTLLLAVGPSLILLIALLFFLPLSETRGLRIEPNNERVDERDVMFSREDYVPGTDTYEAYYTSHPELKDIDDKIRDLPKLLMPGGKYYEPVGATYTEAIFQVINDMTTMADGPVAAQVKPVSSGDITPRIKKLTQHLGAVDVGVARLDPRHVYSHVGRGPEPWGAPIDNHHRNVIVFTIEMDYEHVETAPRLPITMETAKGYLDAAVISIALARHIRDMGYSARAHLSGSNYQVMLPPVACDSGLGELGRHGYLISPRLGSRLRLGAVTTDLPLETDRPICFGVQDFCDRCKRCAVNCPSASIPTGPPVMVRGVEKWPLQIESCIRYWRIIGTDCGLCMKVCPFSHPSSLVHNLIRAGIKRSTFARRLSVYGEDLFYGKKVRP